MTNEKIAAYYRVSTSRQEKEATIEMQKGVVRECYAKLGRTILKEYEDNGYSGASFEPASVRPALHRLLNDCKVGEITTIAFYDFDRFGRQDDQNLEKQIDYLAMKKSFLDLGIKFEVLGKEIETTGEGGLMAKIKEMFASEERARFRTRSIDGINKKIKCGQYMASVAPFGYRRVKNDTGIILEINPDEAKVVKFIFESYLINKSLGKVAQALYEAGLTGRNGKYFSLFFVGHMLKKEVYIGNWYYRKGVKVEPIKPKKINKKKIETSYKEKSKDQWLKVEVPEIIDKETFYRVQEIRQQKAAQPERPTRHYLCQGLIRCQDCGRLYIGKMRSASHRYKHGCHFTYICPAKSGRRRPDLPLCHSREISMDKVDAAVWGYISSIILDEKKLIQDVRIFREQREGKKEEQKRMLAELEFELNKIDLKKTKLLKLYLNGIHAEKKLNEETIALSQEEIKVQRQIKQIQAEIKFAEDQNNAEKEIEQTCFYFKSKIDNADFDLKKNIIRKWIREIILPKDGGIKISYSIPAGDDVLLPEYPKYAKNPICAQLDGRGYCYQWAHITISKTLLAV